jgi:uncharacterized protein (TIGR03435 family)
MNPKQSLDEILDRYITSAKQEEVESHCEEVFQLLKTRARQRASQPRRNRPTHRSFWLVAAAVAATIAIALLLPARIAQSAPATLEDASGTRKIQFGEIVRPIGDMSAMLSMADGPLVETRSMSEFSLERADDGGTRIRLKVGGLIVDAASRRGGNLYVQTKDITALVSGAVSLVKAEAEGSSVFALGGEVRVRQGSETKNLRPGEQIRTNPQMQVLPVPEEIAWSQNADSHVALLQQQPVTTAPSTLKRLEFEVASVRLLSEGVPNPGARFGCRGANGVISPESSAPPTNVPEGRCVGEIGLQPLVALAYNIPRRYVSGRTNWSGQPFQLIQINAKAPDPATIVTMEHLRQMLQSLLAERFKLEFHRQKQESQEHLLRVARDGIKFKPASGPEEPPRMLPSGLGQPGITIRGKSEMVAFARFLTSIVGFPVIDQTAISGIHDYSLGLNIVPGQRGGDVGVRGAGGGGGAGNISVTEFDPPVSIALQEQLGLRLDRDVISVEMFIIDRADKPSEN